MLTKEIVALVYGETLNNTLFFTSCQGSYNWAHYSHRFRIRRYFEKFYLRPRNLYENGIALNGKSERTKTWNLEIRAAHELMEPLSATPSTDDHLIHN